MVSAAFKRLKQRSGAEELQRLKDSFGFKAGKHKRTRLVRAVGTKIGKRTILEEAIHAQHQDKLFARFRKAWGGLTDAQARERLRLLTILGTVCVVETTAILQTVEEMEAQLRIAFSNEIKGIGILGVSEVEIVNLALYGEKDTKKAARKGQVLRELAEIKGIKDIDKEHLAHVHFHAVVDLGPHAATTEQRVGKVLRQTWQGSWCVELKGLFTNRSVEKSLRFIGGYFTKGGNDTLRFRKQFGSESPEAMELSMAKQGYAESGEYGDHLGLSIEEIRVLVNVYDALMRRNSARDGYLFVGGTVIRDLYKRRSHPISWLGWRQRHKIGDNYDQYRYWKSALAKR